MLKKIKQKIMKTLLSVPLLMFYGILLIFTLSCTIKQKSATLVTDIDGNVYHIETIGSQMWMAENLKVIHYQNGDKIPNITDSIVWSNLSMGAYCSYDNDSSNVAVYGHLYNWYTVNDSRKLCPMGWHVPSNAEWTILVDCVGSNSFVGGKMKEAGTTHWSSPNTGANNSCNFAALPCGTRGAYSNFGGLGSFTGWWSTWEDADGYAYYLLLQYSNADVLRYSGNKKIGFSVRCIQD